MIIAKQDEIFSQQLPSFWSSLQFLAKRYGMPVAAQHLAAWCLRADAGQRFIFFNTQCHGSSPSRLLTVTGGRYIESTSAMSTWQLRMCHCRSTANSIRVYESL